MKLLVCTNFAQPFHTGGAERVIQQITSSLVNEYGWNCTVFCQHGTSPVFFAGTKVVPVGKLTEAEFIEKIRDEDPDHIFVYSDWFFRWEAILKNAEKFTANKSIGLVGMNRMRSSLPQNTIVTDLFKNKYKEFKVLAHANNYVDAVVCRQWGIPVTIIHNAIDLGEFGSTSLEFKKRFEIKTEKMLLCVANFFPGKGQEYLLPIIKKLSSKHDVSLVFVHSTLAFEHGNRLQIALENKCKSMSLPVRFLKDLPRKDVISSYFAADAFVFPSQSECGPIVVLEAMAARKPWVALNVGHIPELKGGFVVDSIPGPNSFLRFDNNVANTFERNIDTLLTDVNISKQLGIEGRNQVEQDYNWDKVKVQYRNFFECRKLAL